MVSPKPDESNCEIKYTLVPFAEMVETNII